mmetsp:Transcript_6955/g.11834  ORF Transcript_6955/g.11834 Transcript_6955/m.11834 type:complete len:257 (+) Transcript_6955:73-843(+)|eukprot:CAMPEP_0119108016 /NCGR_PEP_ID=MMETSP1180-20130426/13034_1 /TAXON_ID=3052 ORGANISM="Chlamydomonas cf sp, Strain CCMP681" /NCGR_SAMPLE_ID=MMETSP1180 /ASSEMBLY_ACC=CAM_ASM_000741 /LENGTH=256 /DNA_ID=CAMNT_0007093579 /DNA_START=68 /DNA_END=838 /DNA_ORIENTATION=+
MQMSMRVQVHPLSSKMSRGSLAVMAAWTRKTVVTDPWFLKAKKEGYVSRAAYKLKEIQLKHKVVKPGGRVLDLGCSPGAWMQVACQELGPKERGGLVLGIDIQAVCVPDKFCDTRVKVLQADARTLPPSVLIEYAPQGFDTVLSDMLHSTSGVNDVELSLELAGTALHIATGYFFDEYGEEYAQRVGFRHTGYLRPGGSLVMKVYEGSGTNDFMRSMQRYFTKVARMRVDASRSASREFFAVGVGRKKPLQTEEAA